MTTFRGGGRVLSMAALAAMLLACGCSTMRHQNDHWLAVDKLEHFAVFGLAGGAAAKAALDSDRSDGQAFFIGISVSTGLGAGKEVYDDKIRGHHFSGKDLVWDVAGGLVGSLIAIEAD
jgi:putative lipoprotein